MQIKRGTDHAARAMCHLAALPRGRRARLEDVAAAVDVPASSLSKIMQRLASAGLILSTPGATGGFELARPARQISLLEVITAFEGPLTLNLCIAAPELCRRKPYCPVHCVWIEAQARLLEVLTAATLDTLVTAERAGDSGEAMTG